MEEHMARFPTLLAVLAWIALPAVALGQDAAGDTPAETESHSFVVGDAITFEPLEVPGFDPGIELAVLHGNPMGESGDYTVRLRFPDDYRFPAHYHPRPEHLTVLSGTFLIAMGTDENPDAIEEYEPGAYLYFPPEQPHYGGAEGETVIQLHGEAPFEIILANTGT
jgi:mannose-6-phosphate isomerase-like protein (cupin superfamily)